MSEPQDARDMLDRAERAATAGDFASADELLRGAARIQEEQLGPRHPDLANTLNNLAIVAERTGRPDEAEAFYRRAVAIASASLPPDDPMVVASRQNLEDFCRARGVPIDPPAVVARTPEAAVPALAPSVEPAPRAIGPRAAAPPAPARAAEKPATPPSAAPRAPAPIAAGPLPPVPAGDKSSGWAAGVTTGVVVLLALVLLFWRPWSSRDESTQSPAGTAPPPETAPQAIGTPTEPNEPRKTAPRSNEPDVPTKDPGAPSSAPGGVTVAAQLCRHFSTSGGNWRCDAVDAAVAPGALVLYTRVKSPRNAAIVHRWYRGNSLRQSVTLTVRANATEGYRTYSRQTVSPGEWRVEVRSTDGHLLHEQQFAVK